MLPSCNWLGLENESSWTFYKIQKSWRRSTWKMKLDLCVDMSLSVISQLTEGHDFQREVGLSQSEVGLCKHDNPTSFSISWPAMTYLIKHDPVSVWTQPHFPSRDPPRPLSLGMAYSELEWTLRHASSSVWAAAWSTGMLYSWCLSVFSLLCSYRSSFCTSLCRTPVTVCR